MSECDCALELYSNDPSLGSDRERLSKDRHAFNFLLVFLSLKLFDKLDACNNAREWSECCGERRETDRPALALGWLATMPTERPFILPKPTMMFRA